MERRRERKNAQCVLRVWVEFERGKTSNFVNIMCVLKRNQAKKIGWETKSIRFFINPMPCKTRIRNWYAKSAFNQPFIFNSPPTNEFSKVSTSIRTSFGSNKREDEIIVFFHGTTLTPHTFAIIIPPREWKCISFTFQTKKK